MRAPRSLARLRAALSLPTPPRGPAAEAAERLTMGPPQLAARRALWAQAPEPAPIEPPPVEPPPVEPPPVEPPPSDLDPADGAHTLTAEAFATYATAVDTPGMGRVAEVKLLIEGVRSGNPTISFMNTHRWAYHYDFARAVRGVRLSLAGFNATTYFTDARDFIAASLVYYDHVVEPAGGPPGLYALEFWPGDPVAGEAVVLTWRLLQVAVPGARLAYHPASGAHEERLARDRAVIEAGAVALVTTETLYTDVRFAPLNPGVGYGVLRLIDGSDGRPPTVRDVVIYTTAPNDLPHVAGVITEQPQTPLSHINLKAKQNDTPNAYLADARKRSDIKALLGETVRFEVTPDGYGLRLATAEEVEVHLEAVRPPTPQTPVADLTVTALAPLARLRNPDSAAYGAKAANLGELTALLPPGVVPQGFAVPFAAYHDFMAANGLFNVVAAMLEAPDFIADVAVRDVRLAALRKRIKKADIPEPWRTSLGELQAQFPPGTSLRCRSSTNNEDLEGFNGAGLYDSYTHHPDEGHLGRTLRQVWASLWTLRAVDERTFYRVDHAATCMAVAVHPNFAGERVNGVAITRNVLDPRFEGDYLNCQVGEALVTNPEVGDVPEEIVIGFVSDDPDAYEIIPIRRSSRVGPGERVLSDTHIAELVGYLRVINPHFRQVYGRRDATFAMDLEFKVDAEGAIIIKQARPYVD